LWLHSLKVAQLLRSAACLHTNQSRSYLNHLVVRQFSIVVIWTATQVHDRVYNTSLSLVLVWDQMNSSGPHLVPEGLFLHDLALTQHENLHHLSNLGDRVQVKGNVAYTIRGRSCLLLEASRI